MKDLFVTVTGINHYYGIAPFKIGKKLKCKKEKNNPFDNEAIKVTMHDLGTIGYIANGQYTKATGTQSAGAIAHKVNKKFVIKVLFIVGSSVICKVVDGKKVKKALNDQSVEIDIPKQELAIDKTDESIK